VEKRERQKKGEKSSRCAKGKKKIATEPYREGHRLGESSSQRDETVWQRKNRREKACRTNGKINLEKGVTKEEDAKRFTGARVKPVIELAR